MNGKPTFQKTLQRMSRTQTNNVSSVSGYLDVGSWRFEENAEGDLVVTNFETLASVVICCK